MAQDAFPVSLLTGVDRVPVPILDHVGAGGEIGVDVEPELAVVRRELPGRIPAKRLRICFRYQEFWCLSEREKSPCNACQAPSRWSWEPW